MREGALAPHQRTQKPQRYLDNSSASDDRLGGSMDGMPRDAYGNAPHPATGNRTVPTSGTAVPSDGPT
jgi:hypothetical protein